VKIKVIAELAQGYEGNFEQAKLLLNAAASAGADAAKYQLVYADELATPEYEYYELFRSLEMKDEEWGLIAKAASDLNIELQFDIFGSRSLALAERLGVKAVKLHGTDINNQGLLEEIRRSGINVVMLGAGGAFSSEVDTAVDLLSGKQVTVILGFQGYPTPVKSNQIARIQLLSRKKFKLGGRVTLGFADHADPTSDLRHALATVAIGAGATLLEKHLTLARNMKLEDHEAAINPDEFGEFVDTIRECADAMGTASELSDFGMSEEELRYREMIRRHVVAKFDLKKGLILSHEHLALKRTPQPSAETDLSRCYGKLLKRDLTAGSPILLDDLNE